MPDSAWEPEMTEREPELRLLGVRASQAVTTRSEGSRPEKVESWCQQNSPWLWGGLIQRSEDQT